VNPVQSPERPFSSWRLVGLGGAPALLFDECSSTHRYMHEEGKRLELGTLIVANAQSLGRGRHERIWRAPANKNLSFNLLVSLEGLSPEQWAQTTQIAALTLCRLLQDWGIACSVKWPNDLLWNKHKICGILSELVRRDDGMALSIGIGLNVNSDVDDFQGLDRLATSLGIILGGPLDREEILRQFLTHFQTAMERFRLEGPGPWVSEWRRMDQFLGTRGRIVGSDGVVEGTILDIQEDGSLRFQTDSGDTRTIWSGDLEI
jgi:BirA family transcriptional regulator, biotin operon repressor / biotin---[acetyl-CoA-carboxylase] ligase